MFPRCGSSNAVYRFLCLGAVIFTGLKAQLSASSRSKLTASRNPVYVAPSGDARVTWNYFGDIPHRIVLRAQLKNSSQTLDLWTITVLNSGNDKRIEQNRFLHQTEAKTLSGRTYAEYNHNQFELIVEKFTANDTKFAFVCVVEFDTFNSIRSHVEIFIQVPPRITSTFYGTRRVAKGGWIELQCTATGSPTPSLEWKKSGVIRSSGIATVDLVMNNIQPEDTGTYTCNAVNQAGTADKSVAITVTYIEMDEAYTRVRQHAVGTKAEISCPVLGYPKPSYKWEKDGIVVGGYQALVFDPIDLEDFSIYRCVASNIAGSKSTTVELASEGPKVSARGSARVHHACSHGVMSLVGVTILLISLR